jgi:hypothetical protein
VTDQRGTTPAGRRASLLAGMAGEARESGVVARRIHLVVAIDRLLVRLVDAAPGAWVVKGGYANQLRRPDTARFTEDLDLRLDATIESAPVLLASALAVDAGDDLAYAVMTAPSPLDGPPGGGLRFLVAAHLAGTELVRFKVDVSAADVVIGPPETCGSDPVLGRLGFAPARFPVYPVDQHVAEKLHALTLPRDVENTRARDLVDLAWFIMWFTFRSQALAAACAATFERRGTHPWPPAIPEPPASWDRPYAAWRSALDLQWATPAEAAAAVRRFLEPAGSGIADLVWDPDAQGWEPFGPG